MSERMIELQRAKMGLPIKTAQSGPPNSSKEAGSSTSMTSSSIPQVYAQDEKVCLFLRRLKHTKPTVPPSLTRRVLNKQGVGYSDPLVSTIVSSAADRFLATVLSQALVCRDMRLEGEELARKGKRELERSKRRRRSERDQIQNKRQKLEKELEEFAKGPGGSHKKDSRKLSPELASVLEKGGLDANFKIDSIHEEESHYENLNDEKNEKEGNGNESYEEDESDIDDEDDEDDDRDILQLRDLARPLEAWGMTLTGKILAAEPTVRVPKEKTITDNDDENLVLEGEEAVEDEEDDIGIASGDTEKTPIRRKKAMTPKPSPKKNGRVSPVPGKSDDISSTQGKK